jgi:regulatory protein YycH of two-component signal transduction system YycFG
MLFLTRPYNFDFCLVSRVLLLYAYDRLDRLLQFPKKIAWSVYSQAFQIMSHKLNLIQLNAVLIGKEKGTIAS